MSAPRTHPERLRSTHWLRLVGSWLLCCVSVGGVMYLVTTFLFAFSSSQSGMVPVVNAAPWIVDLGVLIIGLASLARTRSPGSTTRVMLAATLSGWLLAVALEWLLSFRLGATHVSR